MPRNEEWQLSETVNWKFNAKFHRNESTFMSGYLTVKFISHTWRTVCRVKYVHVDAFITIETISYVARLLKLERWKCLTITATCQTFKLLVNDRTYPLAASVCLHYLTWSIINERLWYIYIYMWYINVLITTNTMNRNLRQHVQRPYQFHNLTHNTKNNNCTVQFTWVIKSLCAI
jgi:hypothetical protein